MKNFDHLAGRGLHELRADELADYVMSIAGDAGAQRTAVAWVASELERKTNDERVVAVELQQLRERVADTHAKVRSAVSDNQAEPRNRLQRIDAHIVLFGSPA